MPRTEKSTAGRHCKRTRKHSKISLQFQPVKSGAKLDVSAERYRKRARKGVKVESSLSSDIRPTLGIRLPASRQTRIARENDDELLGGRNKCNRLASVEISAILNHQSSAVQSCWAAREIKQARSSRLIGYSGDSTVWSRHCWPLYMILLALAIKVVWVEASNGVISSGRGTISSVHREETSDVANPAIERSLRATNPNSNPPNESVIVRVGRNGNFKGRVVSKTAEASQTPPVAAFYGIRYAISPEKHLRFMPPSPFYYSPDKTHEMLSFGPICRQRWPSIPVAARLWSASNRSEPLKSNELLEAWRKSMPRKVFAHFAPKYRLLSQFDQSEDCLNLNIFTPYEGKLFPTDQPSHLSALESIDSSF